MISRALLANTASEAVLLYSNANTQFSELNTFEQLWAAWYLWIGNPTMATGVMSFLMHEVSDLI